MFILSFHHLGPHCLKRKTLYTIFVGTFLGIQRLTGYISNPFRKRNPYDNFSL